MTRIHKFLPSTIDQVGERQVRVIASTADVDRMGDVVVQEGINLSEFLKNPVVLASHDPEHVIGTASGLRLSDGKLVATIDFAPAGLSRRADEVCSLVKAGILKGVSIGFDGIESEPITPGKPYGPRRFLKSMLYEISIVAIPANADAEVIARALSAPDRKEGRRLSTATTQAIEAALDHHEKMRSLHRECMKALRNSEECLSELLDENKGDDFIDPMFDPTNPNKAKALRIAEALALAHDPVDLDDLSKLTRDERIARAAAMARSDEVEVAGLSRAERVAMAAALAHCP